MIALVLSIIGTSPSRQESSGHDSDRLEVSERSRQLRKSLGRHHGVFRRNGVRESHLLLEDVGSWRASHTFYHPLYILVGFPSETLPILTFPRLETS